MSLSRSIRVRRVPSKLMVLFVSLVILAEVFCSAVCQTEALTDLRSSAPTASAPSEAPSVAGLTSGLTAEASELPCDDPDGSDCGDECFCHAPVIPPALPRVQFGAFTVGRESARVITGPPVAASPPFIPPKIS
ncbi:MAG: hypothetical protein IPM63_18200 [Acidobacteriota bacterium]|nr:MAG: hypothetical protein IPM63_18200 [Acidobacteriota bacterium]